MGDNAPNLNAAIARAGRHVSNTKGVRREAQSSVRGQQRQLSCNQAKQFLIFIYFE